MNRQHHLAQLNIATLLAPIDSPQLKEFVDSLDAINLIADQSSGFLWRLQTEDGDATGIDYFGCDTIVNMSVWKDLASLRDYVYSSGHVDVLKRRKQWFTAMSSAHMVLWWVPAGHIPDLAEAEARLQKLRQAGASESAFTFRHNYPPPSS